MHSLKQTIIAVGLLGLSFGLYHISLTPSDIPPPTTGDGKSTGRGTAESVSSEDPTRKFEPGLSVSQLAPPEFASFGSSDSSANDFPPAPKIEVPSIPVVAPTTPPITPLASAAPATPAVSPIAPKMESSPQLGATENRFANNSSDLRKPVESSDFNGVQSIHYPSGVGQSDESDSRMVQREPISNVRDQGLMDALNTNRGGDRPSDENHFIAAFQPPAQNSSTPSTADFTSFGSSFGAASEPPMASQIAASTMSEGFAATSTGADTLKNNGMVKPAITSVEIEQLTFKTVWEKVDEFVQAEDYHMALRLLSRFYRDESLNGPQRQRLLGWLDALAAKVIFSTEDHLQGQPYLVKPQETLRQISERWQVPVQLVANINGESFVNREVVPAGTPLKHIEGPFHAELKLGARVITLFLGDCYAGRFSVVVGTSGEPRLGVYDVVLKSEGGYNWYDSSGKEYPIGSAENGYGPHWIGLTGSLCIHAIEGDLTEGHRGCIGLSPQDAADLFAILSETSKLTITP